MRRWFLYTTRRYFVIGRLVYFCLSLAVLYIIGIPKLIGQLMLDPATIDYYRQRVTKDCSGHFYGYVNQFAHLKKVIVDPDKADGRPGGEDISEVLGQKEDVEYFRFYPGYFTLPCRQVPLYSFRDESHLNEWKDAILPRAADVPAKNQLSNRVYRIQNTFTIAVTRYEYVNLYHAMTDFYNAYIMTRIFETDPDRTNILLVDGHPKGSLDGIWNTLFGDVIRAGHLKKPVLFENLVWSIQGYSCPLHRHKKYVIPDLKGFTDFVLRRHNIVSHKILDCSNISVLFVWRRDYVAHPRNPTGTVFRKISNEQELIRGVGYSLVKEGKDQGTVKGVQLEKLDFAEQLRIMSQTDILIGMHGSGLTHTLFLPPHAGLIEIFPKTLLTVNRHFQAITKWRSLHYVYYQNFLEENEEANGTRIVLADMMDIVKRMREKVCGKVG